MTIAPETAVEVATSTALEVRDLRVSYRPAHELIEVVHGVALAVSRGRTLALVGQSGSGKSTIALAAAGLLPKRGEVTGGSITLASRDVTRFTDRDWRPLRGSEIGFVPQDPLSSLDPLQTIGSRLGAELKRHGVPRGSRAERAAELLARVGIVDAAHKLKLRPHELSGGQLQRVLIAIAISGSPQLLIADEPTSALDVTVQRTILDLIGELREELGLAVLLITHDLALARERADDIAVLHEGVVVDQGPAERVVSDPHDDYTRQLFANAPALSPDRYAHLLRPVNASVDAAIEVVGLTKTFPGSPRPAVNGVDLRVRRGSIHALVGESGSGKSTIARVVAGLEPYEGGTVTVSGRRLQMVYQNPLSALDPRFTVRQLLDEPIALATDLSSADRAARVTAALDHVALPQKVLGSRPHDLSGGQRQRVAIARALALSPDILVLDEPTSALDVTVQTQIVDLLMELRDRDELTYLFISHDLSLIRQIAEEVTVLEHGRLVEHAPTAELFAAPRDEYTRRLIAAIPQTA